MCILNTKELLSCVAHIGNPLGGDMSYVRRIVSKSWVSLY